MNNVPNVWETNPLPHELPQIDKTLVAHVADVLSNDPSFKGRITINNNNTINIRSISSPNVVHQLSFKRV